MLTEVRKTMHEKKSISADRKYKNVPNKNNIAEENN